MPFWILDWGFWIGEALYSNGSSLRTAASSVEIGISEYAEQPSFRS